MEAEEVHSICCLVPNWFIRVRRGHSYVEGISADGLIAPDYIALLCLPVILFAIGLALYAISKEHPKRARRYYIVIVLRDGTIHRRWWSNYNHRERIVLALSNARSYRG